MGAGQSSFIDLVRRPDLDEETAYAVCRMIDAVGYDIKDGWDWNWLQNRKGNYRGLIDRSLVAPAWRLLAEKDWFSLQTTNDEEKRVSTAVPLQWMTKLRWLVLQNNLITDLRPLLGMTKLRYLNFYANKVADLSPLAHLQCLEELSLGDNPIESMAVLEELPKLRELAITADQYPALMRCKRLPAIQHLNAEQEGLAGNLIDFPEMPCLRVLNLPGVKDPAGIERFSTLTTLELPYAQFSRLDRIAALKALTHFEIWSPQPVSLKPLSSLFALRSIEILAPEIKDISALARLPVLHRVRLGGGPCGEEAKYDHAEYKAVCEELTPWRDEFTTPDKKVSPSLHVEVVSQETFDLYDSKEPFGIQPGECEDGMFESERTWLEGELRGVLTARFEGGDDKDLFLPGMTAFRRSDRLVVFSLRAYDSFREIAAAVQQVLCEARNDWIICFHSCLTEGPDFEELPEDAEDFIVWIYPDKIEATEENAAIVGRLLD